jgi:hypothetical protein
MPQDNERGMAKKRENMDAYALRALPDEDVYERLRFARRRLDDLAKMIEDNAAGDSSTRQQPIMEFFFHLIGAVEVLAQIVNQRCDLGLPTHSVSVRCVQDKLDARSALRASLESLYVDANDARNVPSEDDWYSDAGVLYRAWNGRNQVTHRTRNPAQLVGHTRPHTRLAIYLLLDPRYPQRGRSKREVIEDLQAMLDLIHARCTDGLTRCPSRGHRLPSSTPGDIAGPQPSA